jgi:hypothetical protein
MSIRLIKCTKIQNKKNNSIQQFIFLLRHIQNGYIIHLNSIIRSSTFILFFIKKTIPILSAFVVIKKQVS